MILTSGLARLVRCQVYMTTCSALSEISIPSTDFIKSGFHTSSAGDPSATHRRH